MDPKLKSKIQLDDRPQLRKASPRDMMLGQPPTEDQLTKMAERRAAQELLTPSNLGKMMAEKTNVSEILDRTNSAMRKGLAEGSLAAGFQQLGKPNVTAPSGDEVAKRWGIPDKSVKVQMPLHDPLTERYTPGQTEEMPVDFNPRKVAGTAMELVSPEDVVPVGMVLGGVKAAGKVLKGAKKVDKALDVSKAIEVRKAKFRSPSPEDFIKSRDKSMNKAFLTPYQKDEMKGWEIYKTDNDVGYALTKEKDMVGIFNNSGVKGAGQEAIVHGIEKGAKTLDNIDGKLTEIYNNAGFVVKDRLKWDDKFAPKDWNYEKYGRPDIVLKRYPESLTRIPEDVRNRIEVARAERLAIITGGRRSLPDLRYDNDAKQFDWEAWGKLHKGKQSEVIRRAANRVRDVKGLDVSKATKGLSKAFDPDVAAAIAARKAKGESARALSKPSVLDELDVGMKIERGVKKHDPSKQLPVDDVIELFMASGKAKKTSAMKSIEKQAEKARELGFDTSRTFFHGTSDEIGEFKKQMLGSTTGSPSAMKGFFFTDQPVVAKGYADLARTGISKARRNLMRENPKLGEKATDLIKKEIEKDRIDFQISKIEDEMDQLEHLEVEPVEEYERLTAKRNKLADLWGDKNIEIINTKKSFSDKERKLYDKFEKEAQVDISDLGSDDWQDGGQNIMPVNLKIQNPYVHDFKGAQFRSESFNNLMKKAQEAGHDSVIFKNVYDSPGAMKKSNIVAVFEPNQVRSVHAKFDPKKKKSGDILAGIAGGVGLREVKKERDGKK